MAELLRGADGERMAGREDLAARWDDAAAHLRERVAVADQSLRMAGRADLADALTGAARGAVPPGPAPPFDALLAELDALAAGVRAPFAAPSPPAPPRPGPRSRLPLIGAGVAAVALAAVVVGLV